MAGWQVEIADSQKVKGLAPLACKTDKIDAWVLAELSRRDLVPAIWLPTPAVRAERERARWRLHLVRHRTALESRIHATLLAFGHPCPVSRSTNTATLPSVMRRRVRLRGRGGPRSLRPFAVGGKRSLSPSGTRGNAWCPVGQVAGKAPRKSRRALDGGP